MARSDYTAPTFTDVPQAQWSSPPGGAVALDAAHLNALGTAVNNSVAGNGIFAIRVLTQAAYNALGTYDGATLYVIQG